MTESVTPVDKPGSESGFSATNTWLKTDLGQALLNVERRLVEDTLDGLFGEQCLQLGVWGESKTFLRFARTQRTACIATPQNSIQDDPPAAFGHMHRLPAATDSIDVLILPHTLDFSERQHAILREVHRVLRSDGHLVVLGFKPGGIWGLRRLIPGAGLPPNSNHLVGDRQLSDWLKLLDLTIHGVTRYFFKWPLTGVRVSGSQLWEQRGRRWWPELAACYMLTAQKRVAMLTPMRHPWRARPKVVAGLVKPSTRVARIHSEVRADESPS